MIRWIKYYLNGTFCQLSLQQLNHWHGEHFLWSSSSGILGKCFTITYSSFCLGPYSGENDNLETSKNLQTYSTINLCETGVKISCIKKSPNARGRAIMQKKKKRKRKNFKMSLLFNIKEEYSTQCLLCSDESRMLTLKMSNKSKNIYKLKKKEKFPP